MVKATNEQGKTAVFCEEELEVLSDAIDAAIYANYTATKTIVSSAARNALRNMNNVLASMNNKIRELMEEDA